mgnify:CR=1 FL=1
MRKIACICGNGLGSSFLLEMNVKTVLKDMGITDIEVEHADMGSAWPGMADLIVCASDLKNNLEKFGKTIGLNNIMDKNELKEKLSLHLNK